MKMAASMARREIDKAAASENNRQMAKASAKTASYQRK